jgi:hypothetical protein
VGGKGQGRGVRSDGAMAMGCGLQGGLPGEARGPKAKGEGSGARGSVRRLCVGLRGIIGHARDQYDQRGPRVNETALT